MRVLHTSDWHLGQRFHHLTRHQEHLDFLNYLSDFIEDQKIDLLIIAGDIFDTANPSREAEKLYYDFLKQIVSLNFCKIIIIGGNHDSASHLNGPKVLLESLNIHIFGELGDNLEELIVDCSTKSQKLHVACIPYLRDADIRKQNIEDSISEIEKKVRLGISKVYSDMFQLMPKDSINIATGHLFAIGSQLGDSERSIHVGNLGAVAQEDIKQGFDYIALGHLHKGQALNKSIHYCGSPIALSFGESKQTKEFIVLDIDQDQIEITKHQLPRFRQLFQVIGSLEQAQSQIDHIASQNYDLTPWIEVKLSQNSLAKQSYDGLFEQCQNHGLELVKVLLDHSLDLIADPKDLQIDISELSPCDIFEQRLELYDGDSNKKDLKKCFSQLLESYYEGQNS